MNLGQSAEKSAVAFQRRLDMETNPEMLAARKKQQAACTHDAKFDCGLCARCGAWTDPDYR